MTPYYIIFALFTILTLWLKLSITDHYVDSILSLFIYGAAIIIPLLGLFFIMLFQFTNGMKYFVARKPTLYHLFNRITYNPKA